MQLLCSLESLNLIEKTKQYKNGNGNQETSPSPKDRNCITQANKLEEPLVLSEDGSALSDDIRLLPLRSVAW